VKKIILILLATSMLNVFATESTEVPVVPETETVETENVEQEITETNTEDVVANTETEVVEPETGQEPEDNNTVIQEGDGYLHIESAIKEDTNVLSDEIYIALYNYDQGKTEYVKLTRKNNYEATVNLQNGLYDAYTFRCDERDTIAYDNSTFTMNSNEYTIRLTITGVTDTVYEDAQITEQILNGDTDVQALDNITGENPEELQKTETSELENSGSEKAATIQKSAFHIFLEFVIDNIIVLILLFGSIIFLGIYKAKQNKGE